MKKENIRRYAVYGLMEFMLRLPTPAGAVDVHFVGGQLSGYGIVPATFTTSDPLLAALIEATPEYKSGKIVTV